MQTRKELLQADEREMYSLELLSLFYEILSEEEFTFRIKQVVPYMRQINESSIPQATLEKFNQAINREYKHYLYFCNLLRDKKINITHAISDFNLKGIKVHNLINNNYPNCEIYKDRVVIHPPLIRNFPSMIPGRSFKNDNLNVGLMCSQTELLYYIANSKTNIALHYVNDDYYINDYNLELGYTPILLALCKDWDHIHPRKYSLTQKPIIDALLAKGALDVHCIHLKNGMTPLHIACLRGECSELVKKLLARGADCNALDYQGRKPADMLHLSDKEINTIISDLSGSLNNCCGRFKKANSNIMKSEIATTPASQERKHYMLNIRYFLAKSAVRKVIPDFV